MTRAPAAMKRLLLSVALAILLSAQTTGAVCLPWTGECVKRDCSPCAIMPHTVEHGRFPCKEWGRDDPNGDCCALRGTGGCPAGYQLSTTTGAQCWEGDDVVTTCCEPVGGCTEEKKRDDSKLATMSVCREWNYPEKGWNVDEDCCALRGSGACADGYDFAEGGECFDFFGCKAYSSVCTKSADPAKDTMSKSWKKHEPYQECEPDFGPLIGGIIGGIVFIALVSTAICYCCKCGCFTYRRIPTTVVHGQGGGLQLMPMGTYAPGLQGVPQGVPMGNRPIYNADGTIYNAQAAPPPAYPAPPPYGAPPAYPAAPSYAPPKT